MAQDTDTTPPALKAAFEATDLNVLPLDKAVLLGTFVRGDGSAAVPSTFVAPSASLFPALPSPLPSAVAS